MHAAGGYALIVGPEGSVEMDTFTCSHCGGIVHEPPDQTTRAARAVFAGVLADNRGKKCLGCRQPICRGCEERQARTGRCVTYEAKLDAMEKVVQSDAARRALFRELEIEG